MTSTLILAFSRMRLREQRIFPPLQGGGGQGWGRSVDCDTLSSASNLAPSPTREAGYAKHCLESVNVGNSRTTARLCEPPRSHPRKRGPCSTLRLALPHLAGRERGSSGAIRSSHLH